MSKKMTQKQDSFGKFMCYVLGNRPDEFGLHPDLGGFIPVKALLAALHDEEGWRGVREGQILTLTNQPGDLSSFEVVEESSGLKKGLKIRLKPALANLPPEAPAANQVPKLLYLALKPAAWAVIHERGLFPKTGDTTVRLWSDEKLARRLVGRLGSGGVLVTVQAQKALQAGAAFTPWSELLWLTDEVPSQFLMGPTVPPREVLPDKRKSEKKPEPVGSFHVEALSPEIHRGKVKGKHGDAPDWKNQSRRDRRRQDNDN